MRIPDKAQTSMSTTKEQNSIPDGKIPNMCAECSYNPGKEVGLD